MSMWCRALYFIRATKTAAAKMLIDNNLSYLPILFPYFELFH